MVPEKSKARFAPGFGPALGLGIGLGSFVNRYFHVVIRSTIEYFFFFLLYQEVCGVLAP